MLMAKKKGGLPPGVVLYDRLIGDGTAYIDTGITPLYATDKISFCAKLDQYKGATFINAGSGANRFEIYGSSSTTRNFYYVSYPASAQRNCNLPNYIQFFNEGWIDMASGTSNFGGVASSGLNNNTLTPTWKASSSLKIMYNYKSTFKYFRYERSGGIIIDWHPCTYNGVAGMWDMVNNTFHGNANTSGSFSVAND